MENLSSLKNLLYQVTNININLSQYFMNQLLYVSKANIKFLWLYITNTSVAKTEAELLETSKTIQSIATSISVFEKKMTEMTRFATQVDIFIFFYSCLFKAGSVCFKYIHIDIRFCNITHMEDRLPNSHSWGNLVYVTPSPHCNIRFEVNIIIIKGWQRYEKRSRRIGSKRLEVS